MEPEGNARLSGPTNSNFNEERGKRLNELHKHVLLCLLYTLLGIGIVVLLLNLFQAETVSYKNDTLILSTGFRDVSSETNNQTSKLLKYFHESFNKSQDDILKRKRRSLIRNQMKRTPIYKTVNQNGYEKFNAEAAIRSLLQFQRTCDPLNTGQFCKDLVMRLKRDAGVPYINNGNKKRLRITYPQQIVSNRHSKALPDNGPGEMPNADVGMYPSVPYSYPNNDYVGMPNYLYRHQCPHHPLPFYHVPMQTPVTFPYYKHQQVIYDPFYGPLVTSSHVGPTVRLAEHFPGNMHYASSFPTSPSSRMWYPNLPTPLISHFEQDRNYNMRQAEPPKSYPISSTVKSVNMTGRQNECSPGTMACDDGECLDEELWCNGLVECRDASDEARCSCKSRIDKSRNCDGYFDCPLGEDELGCNGCKDHEFTCDYQGISQRATCFNKEQRCDNVPNCPNRKDELECEMLTPSLHDKPEFAISQTEGFLHRNFKGHWYPVCENPYFWAENVCLRETGLLLRPPLVQLAPVNPMYHGKFVSHVRGDVLQMSLHCYNSSAAYVTCPDMMCGTRVSTGIQILHEEMNNENDLFGRNKRMPNDDFEDASIGMRTKRLEGRVVGGKPSEPASWPWLVAMYRDGSFHCGGVLVSKQWVVSAAHCVHRYWEHYYQVQVGMLRRFSFSPQEHIHTISHIIINKFYDKRDMKNDLSLLRLEFPVMYSKWIRPVCLPGVDTAGPNWKQGPQPGTMCVAVGWGATKEHGPDPDHLREVLVPILSECKHNEDRVGHELCAGFKEGGKDACQGDSGGPLLCRNPLNVQQWYMAGIVSHGEGCARKDEPGVYTRVSLFVDWIRFNIASLNLPNVVPKQECPGFKCSSGISKCLPKSRFCDKVVDCLDGEDELHCDIVKNAENNENPSTSVPFEIARESDRSHEDVWSREETDEPVAEKRIPTVHKAQDESPIIRILPTDQHEETSTVFLKNENRSDAPTTTSRISIFNPEDNLDEDRSKKEDFQKLNEQEGNKRISDYHDYSDYHDEGESDVKFNKKPSHHMAKAEDPNIIITSDEPNHRHPLVDSSTTSTPTYQSPYFPLKEDEKEDVGKYQNFTSENTKKPLVNFENQENGKNVTENLKPDIHDNHLNNTKRMGENPEDLRKSTTESNILKQKVFRPNITKTAPSIEELEDRSNQDFSDFYDDDDEIKSMKNSGHHMAKSEEPTFEIDTPKESSEKNSSIDPNEPHELKPNASNEMQIMPLNNKTQVPEGTTEVQSTIFNVEFDINATESITTLKSETITPESVDFNTTFEKTTETINKFNSSTTILSPTNNITQTTILPNTSIEFEIKPVTEIPEDESTPESKILPSQVLKPPVTLTPVTKKKFWNIPKIFRCRRINQTIPFTKRCDRQADCEDGSDEMDCNCGDYVRTFNSKLLCDGIVDCLDGMDEIDCSSCPKDQFLCKRSGFCVSQEYVCDGAPHCPKGEDELDCFALSNAEYLTFDMDGRPKVNTEGYLTMKKKNSWAVVCEENENMKESEQERIATNICTYLGFSDFFNYKVKHFSVRETRSLNVNIDRNKRAFSETKPIKLIFKSKSSEGSDEGRESELKPVKCLESIRKTCISLYVQCAITLQSDLSKTKFDNFNKPFDMEKPFEHKDISDEFLWPWLAKIYLNGEYKCTGVLIDFNWVLINHDCLWRVSSSKDYISAILGTKQVLVATRTAHEQTYRVDGKKDIFESKVTLLHLESPAVYSRYVRPMIIPSANMHKLSHDVCVAIGVDEQNNTSPVLLEEVDIDCGINNRCFKRHTKESCHNINPEIKPWRGIISCEGEGGWFPAATFVEPLGACGFRGEFAAPTISHLRSEIKGSIMFPWSGEQMSTPQCHGVRCSRGTCVPMAKVCDGIQHCEDHADESPQSCAAKQTFCLSDELSSHCACAAGEMKCQNGKCLPKELFSNRINDCGDGSDEPSGATCAEYLALTQPQLLCDGFLNCADRTDESSSFCKCYSEESFKCFKSSFCVSMDVVCDGITDCPEGEDEQICLALGSTQDEPYGVGEVIERKFGQWQTKCYTNPKHTKRDLEQICNALGFNSGHAVQLSADRPTMHVDIITEPFDEVSLNHNTKVFLRNSKTPLARAVEPDSHRVCYPLKIECH